ncbi:hypothetical protein IWX49DRAFT_80712 [Phyllosticta citricarpa]
MNHLHLIERLSSGRRHLFEYQFSTNILEQPRFMTCIGLHQPELLFFMLLWVLSSCSSLPSAPASASIQVMKTSFSSRVRELRGSTWQLGAKLLALSFYLRSRQSFQGLAGPFSHAGLQLTVIWVGTWLVLFWRFLILLRFLVLFQHLCQSRLRTVPECCPACPDFRKLCFGIRHTLSMVSASSRALVCYLVIGFSSPDSDCLCEPSCWDMIA